MARFLALLTSLSPVHPAYFPGSQILSAKQGSALNGLAGFGTTQNWTMCYSSFTNVSNTPAVYHEQCDRHTKTLHVVINHVAGAPRIFGAFAVRASLSTALLLTRAHFRSSQALHSDADHLPGRCISRRRARGVRPHAAP
jgi:hypothetical protein